MTWRFGNLEEFEEFAKKLAPSSYEQTLKTAYELFPQLLSRVSVRIEPIDPIKKPKPAKDPEIAWDEAMDRAANALLEAALIYDARWPDVQSYTDGINYTLARHRTCAFTQLRYRSQRVKNDAQEIISIAFNDHGKTVEDYLGDDLEKKAMVALRPAMCAHGRRLTALMMLAAEALAMACSVGSINPPTTLFD